MSEIKLSEKIIPEFYGAWKAYDNPRYLNIYEKGGRGSSKSTTITLKIVMNRMKTKSHALCVTKHKENIRKTVRNQIIWSILHLGVQDSWKWSNTETGNTTITYIPTGTKIYFEGADGDSVKGWKTPDMPTTDIFFEEIQRYKTDEELTSIKLSILRQILPIEYKYTFFHAYNPPKRKQSWVNKLCESVIKPDNMYVHHSDYTTNPFLPEQFLIEALHIKETNPRRHDWEYLGKPIGSGIVPFDNLDFREITDDEFKSFDNFRAGCDWGYAIDPVAFVVWHFDSTRRIIYAVDEIYRVKMSNEELAKEIQHKGWQHLLTIADSAEPKSVADLKRNGCNFKSAKKGKGSVEHGEKWLDELEAIVIDPVKTPKLAIEFENIDYETDKDGNIRTRLVDKDNHGIDGTRYGFEKDMRNSKGVSFLN